METHDALGTPKRTMAIAGLVGLVVMFGLAGAVEAAKKPKRRPFTETVVTASILSHGSRSVFEVSDSVSGHGAGVVRTTFSGSSSPALRRRSEHSVFPRRSLARNGQLHDREPNAHRISRITGKGRCLGGTGVYRTKRCTFTFSGTADTNPGGVVKSTIRGGNVHALAARGAWIS